MKGVAQQLGNALLLRAKRATLSLRASKKM
jgi:hypothetical protein